MISYKRALKLMKQNIKVSDKSEIVNIKNSYKRIVSKIFFLTLIIQKLTLQQWMG